MTSNQDINLCSHHAPRDEPRGETFRIAGQLGSDEQIPELPLCQRLWVPVDGSASANPPLPARHTECDAYVAITLRVMSRAALIDW